MARSFNSWFAPFMYGLIPLMGADFVARVMPKFFNHAPRLISSIIGIFGTQVSWADLHILPNDWLVRAQYLIIAIGTVTAIYTSTKIAGKDYHELTHKAKTVQIISASVALLLGVGMLALYFWMQGAE